MAKYSASNLLGGTQQSLSTSYKTLLAVFATSGSLRRGKVFDLLLGTDGTPADNALDWDVSRMTANGTGTAVTPNPLDPADVAMLGTVNVNYTAEPTVTGASSLIDIGVNQRASYRWVAAPGSEILYPATANNGIVIRAKSASYTGTATATALVDEQ